MGAVEGLFSIHSKMQNDQLKYDFIPIDGPKSVQELLFLPEIQLVLMIAGNSYKNGK